MDELKLAFEWVDPLEARVPELRATWASLSVEVQGEPVTQLYDPDLRSVRDRLFLPLYPMAEWIAQHWWHLLYETETPSRSTASGYAHRHSLRYAREGYALPDLTFRSFGDTLELAWQAARLPGYRLEFMRGGTALLETETVKDTLARFIRAVVERLHQYDLYGTPLEQEWAALQATDAEETSFCIAAARLGLDPYDVSEAESEAIVAASSLPESLQEAFFRAADPARLTKQLSLLRSLLERRSDVHGTWLVQLRHRFPMQRDQPWKEGYAYARYLREELKITYPLSSSPALAEALKLEAADLEQIVKPTDSARLFDALVVIDSGGSPCFAIDERREENQRFAFCRGLFEFLATANGEPVLVTRTRSERQKRNRAFAAEFLAPADMIREKIAADRLWEDDLEELGEVFGVSPRVIRHQVINHRLAFVEQAPAS
jgi:Zn-dependent peptidase ImmA (M78 family)